MKLTAVCTLGALAALFGILSALTGSGLRIHGPLFIPYVALTCGGALIGVIGLFRHRRWGLYLFTAAHILDVTTALISGDWRWQGVLIAALLVTAAWTQRKLLR